MGAAKIDGRIQHLWFLRVGLADPAASTRSLSTFCKDFGIEHQSAISHTYVSRTRDAFCQIIKSMTRKQVSLLASSLSANQSGCSTPVFLTHIHDEARMRFRSFTELLPAHTARARSSKIQNNVMFLKFGRSQGTLEWLTELQALERKNGETIGEALVSVTEEVLQVLCQASTRRWQTLRFIHLLTGDSVNTNINAAKRLLQFFLNKPRFENVNLQYSLVTWKCVSHVVNLIVVVAIVGQLLGNPAEQDDVCAAASRFYKYLVHDYIEQYNMALYMFLSSNFRVLVGSVDMVSEETRNATGQLQLLYGDDVLPTELLHILNGGLQNWTHIAPGGCFGQRISSLFKVLVLYRRTARSYAFLAFRQLRKSAVAHETYFCPG